MIYLLYSQYNRNLGEDRKEQDSIPPNAKLSKNSESRLSQRHAQIGKSGKGTRNGRQEGSKPEGPVPLLESCGG